jgi:hypothetical protein
MYARIFIYKMNPVLGLALFVSAMGVRYRASFTTRNFYSDLGSSPKMESKNNLGGANSALRDLPPVSIKTVRLTAR